MALKPFRNSETAFVFWGRVIPPLYSRLLSPRADYYATTPIAITTQLSAKKALPFYRHLFSTIERFRLEKNLTLFIILGLLTEKVF
jgi:hypothetical protein